MRDHSDRGADREESRDDRGDDRSRDQQPRGDRGGPDRDGGGADTRFLQLEMSHVLYAEAEGVAKPAFRDLLLEAAKDRLRERFGEALTALAHLAVDELLKDVQASFEVEARIQQFNEDRRPPKERLSELFAARRSRGEARPARAETPQRRTSGRARRKR
jgi:hypothetical protein